MSRDGLSKVLKPKSRGGRKVTRVVMEDEDDGEDGEHGGAELMADGLGAAAEEGGDLEAPTAAPVLRISSKFIESDDDESDGLNAEKPLNIKRAIEFVGLRRRRRKGWISLWGFVLFSALFLTMLTTWYDIGALALTQKSFANFFNRIEWAPGKGPSDVATVADVWTYLDSTLARVYNNSEYGYTPNATDRGHIMRFTKVLNTVTLIKSKARTENCGDPKWARGRSPVFTTPTCYRLPDSYAGPKGAGSETLTIDLSDGAPAVLAELDSAQAARFIDEAVTEIKVQFWFYNPQTRYTSRVRLIFGFDVFGGIEYKGLRTFPIRLYPYETSKDYFVLLCQVLYALFLLLFVLSTTRRIVRETREADSRLAGFLAYWTSLWNILDWVTFILGATGLAFHVVYIRSQGREQLLKNSGGDFGVEWIPDLSRYMMGLSAMFYSWKTLKYFDFEPRVAMLIKTLQAAWPTLTFYAASLIVIMTGYAIGGHMVVGGTGGPEFATFGSSFQSCLRMTTGQITLGTIWPKDASHPATKAAVSIFYWTYVLLVFFILLNMFIAIILDAYNLVVEKNRFGVADHVNVLVFALDGLRVAKEHIISKIFRRPNGSIPKIAEDHCYLYLVELHNSGRIIVRPETLRKELKATPGGHAIVNWLKYLEQEFIALMSVDPLSNVALESIGTRPRTGP